MLHNPSRDPEYHTVTHKSTDEMANHYGFNEAQRAQLSELLSDENRSMWDGVLAGITENMPPNWVAYFEDEIRISYKL